MRHDEIEIEGEEASWLVFHRKFAFSLGVFGTFSFLLDIFTAIENR